MAFVVKKILKVIMWVIFSFLLLFTIIALLIQVPAIQNKLTKYVISNITSKTHTRAELKKIRISFPKSVVIEGLYLEDIHKDTLLYAGKAKINIVFKDLFHNVIHVKSVALDEVNLHLNRTATDSLYNFNFLLLAFSDTTVQPAVKPEKPSKWTFSTDQVSLSAIRLHYDDEYGGMNAALSLKKLKLKMDRIDLARLGFSIDELLVEGMSGTVLIKTKASGTVHAAAGRLPKITANSIQVNNSTFSYSDSIAGISVSADISQLKLKAAALDLNGDLSVIIKQIDLQGNSLAYRMPGKPELKNTFDAGNLKFEHIILAATDLYYSSAKTEASVQKFTATDQNNFAIKEFQTDFSMDQHSITAKKLLVKTTSSSIDADLNLRYSSLKSLADSLQSLVLDADMRSVSIRNSDITYFTPQLTKQKFFRDSLIRTDISGIVNGSLNNLNGKNLSVRTGTNTIVKTDFVITGLPDFKTAEFNFPNLDIHSGRKDIEMVADSLIPKNIELPEKMSLKINFKGQIKSFVSRLDLGSSYGAAQINASIDRNENFKSKVTISDFDLGRLLKDTAMFGPVSLIAEAEGQGLDKNTIKAKIKAEASKVYLNKYTYHNFNIDGAINGQEFDGKINLNDENAVFDFEGLVNLNPNQEQYEFRLNVPGADLKKLNFTNDDIGIGLTAVVSLKGGKVQEINGKAGITNIIIVHEGKKYIMDSLLFASVNEPDKSDLSLSSSVIGMKYTGTFSPADLPAVVSRFINNYFPFSQTVPVKPISGLSAFTFEIQLHNHPVLSEVFLPQLKEFQPGLIQGSFDQAKNELKLIASMKKVVYGTTEINDLEVDVNSDSKTLNYKVASTKISSSQIRFDNFLLDGKLENKIIFTNLSSIDDKKNKKLLIHSRITKNDGNFRLALDPKEFFLMNSQWDIAADNYIEFGKQGYLIHHLFMNKAESQINIASVHDRFNDDLAIELKNFKLDDVSRIIEKDTSLVKGNVDGKVLLKRVNNQYGIIADATIRNLTVRDVPLGNLTVKAENPTADRFNLVANLSGAENNLTVNGYFIPNGGINSISIKAAIEKLSMKTIEVFSMGQITESSGTLSGNFMIQGQTSAPEITGELVFNNAVVKPAALNSLLEFKNETIQLKKDGIYLNSFTILDPDRHTAIVDGKIQMENFRNFIFDLRVNTQDFLLFNTTVKDNKEFNGRMIIDSKIDIKGPMALPVINAKLKIKKGSNFTFAVPEDKLTTDKGEGVVEFTDSTKLHIILSRGIKKAATKSGIKGVDLSSIIEIDKQATLKLLMDPASTDSLVVRGEAALSFAVDRSGKMSLTGAYNLNEGSYLVSLESVIKRKFDIIPGSTIIWNGDPLDAEISINATYSVRASPYDLVADQMSGMSDADKGTYKQRYPFLVFLKLRGEILHPEISFEIQLPPADKGILGGAVNQKLNMLNEDASALNKQVFALLVLGRFIQENPLQTESGGTSSLIRSTVGKFLSAQLNQLSSKVVPGVELNFDIQSYDDYQTGTAQGRTQVEVGLKKQLFNERLTVQVGGSVDVEGEKAKQNSASDITSDVTVEYKLTKDGRYRLKAFRHNQYEGAIEGQLVETGAGVLFLRDFNKWKEVFTRRKNKIVSPKTSTKQ